MAPKVKCFSVDGDYHKFLKDAGKLNHTSRDKVMRIHKKLVWEIDVIEMISGECVSLFDYAPDYQGRDEDVSDWRMDDFREALAHILEQSSGDDVVHERVQRVASLLAQWIDDVAVLRCNRIMVTRAVFKMCLKHEVDTT